MITEVKKRSICYLIAMAMMAVAFLAAARPAEAKTGMYSRDCNGDVFITETGWVQLGDSTFYVHSTRSRAYEKHEACRNTYRWRGNKLYYFGDDARMIKKSTKYTKLNEDHSVKYIYTPGTNHNERWSSEIMRYQRRNKRGRWVDVGQQTNVWWRCDWQP